MFPVETNIPIPPKTTNFNKNILGTKKNKRGKNIYPWQLMEVGDSFFVPFSLFQELTRKQIITKVGTAVGQRKIRTCAEYTQRTLDTGVRVWRIK